MVVRMMKADNEWSVEGLQQYNTIEEMKAGLKTKANDEWPVKGQ